MENVHTVSLLAFSMRIRYPLGMENANLREFWNAGRKIGSILRRPIVVRSSLWPHPSGGATFVTPALFAAFLVGSSIVQTQKKGDMYETQDSD